MTQHSDMCIPPLPIGQRDHSPISPLALHHCQWPQAGHFTGQPSTVHDVDHSVGEVLSALAYNGVLDQTLVIFTSDNGGDIGGIEEQQAREQGFLNCGNLRGDKHTIWEGGFKVPFVVRWPSTIKAGTRTDRMINVVDIFATLQEIVGGEVLDPESAGPDSFGFGSTLLGRETEEFVRPTMVLNDVTGVVAIRMREWKYIEDQVLRPNPKGAAVRQPQPQLYNLKQDPAEATNVIEAHPEIAEKMQQVLDCIRNQGSERLAAGAGT